MLLLPAFLHRSLTGAKTREIRRCTSWRLLLADLIQPQICDGNLKTLAYHMQRAYLQAEKHVSDMVVAAALYAKIDRPAGIVRFAKRQDPDELLNKWSNNLAKLLEVVERSCQQIQKESMVHKVPIGAS